MYTLSLAQWYLVYPQWNIFNKKDWGKHTPHSPVVRVCTEKVADPRSNPSHQGDLNKCFSTFQASTLTAGLKVMREVPLSLSCYCRLLARPGLCTVYTRSITGLPAKSRLQWLQTKFRGSWCQLMHCRKLIVQTLQLCYYRKEWGWLPVKLDKWNFIKTLWTTLSMWLHCSQFHWCPLNNSPSREHGSFDFSSTDHDIEATVVPVVVEARFHREQERHWGEK